MFHRNLTNKVMNPDLVSGYLTFQASKGTTACYCVSENACIIKGKATQVYLEGKMTSSESIVSS